MNPYRQFSNPMYLHGRHIAERQEGSSVRDRQRAKRRSPSGDIEIPPPPKDAFYPDPVKPRDDKLQEAVARVIPVIRRTFKRLLSRDIRISGTGSLEYKINIDYQEVLVHGQLFSGWPEPDRGSNSIAGQIRDVFKLYVSVFEQELEKRYREKYACQARLYYYVDGDEHHIKLIKSLRHMDKRVEGIQIRLFRTGLEDLIKGLT
jgi:hypothetical protein